MSETRKLYYEDVYKKEFTAKVLECGECESGGECEEQLKLKMKNNENTFAQFSERPQAFSDGSRSEYHRLVCCLYGILGHYDAGEP